MIDATEFMLVADEKFRVEITRGVPSMVMSNDPLVIAVHTVMTWFAVDIVAPLSQPCVADCAQRPI